MIYWNGKCWNSQSFGLNCVEMLNIFGFTIWSSVIRHLEHWKFFSHAKSARHLFSTSMSCKLVVCRGLEMLSSSSSTTSPSSPFRPRRNLLCCLHHFHSCRRVRMGGGVHWVHVHTPPPPPPGKKVPLRNVQKKIESSTQICRHKRMRTFRSDTTK